MTDFVDMHFVNMLAGRLARFSIKHRNPLKVNFRCPICGDSQKSKSKARGWIIEHPKSNNLYYNCFNCGVSHSFQNFLKQQDPLIYNDYIAEKFLKGDKKSVSTDDVAKTEKPIFNKKPLAGLKKISQLSHDHPVKQYIQRRQIPSNQHYRLYYAPKFMTWINTLIPGKFDGVKKDEPRLIMPLIDSSGKVFGVSARGFDPNTLRYITIMFDSMPKLFGLDQVDFTKTYFVTEGALDSLFLSNSVAMVGADTNMNGLQNLENAIFVHDAEPRNVEICKRMEKLLQAGHRVCIWPPNMPAKDINEMYLKGVQDIETIIRKNTYSGLEGQLRLREWKKC